MFLMEHEYQRGKGHDPARKALGAGRWEAGGGRREAESGKRKAESGKDFASPLTSHSAVKSEKGGLRGICFALKKAK